MKTLNNISASVNSVSMKIKKNASYLVLLVLLTNINTARAQNATPSLNLNDKICYTVLIALGVIFAIAAAYTLNFASKALKENGGTMNLSFPIFRKMSFNGNTVGVIFLIIVLAAVIWALNF